MLASSGEVHGVLGIIVDLNCLGQRLGVPAITLARHVAAFSTARQRKTGFTVRNDITSHGPLLAPLRTLGFPTLVPAGDPCCTS